MKKIVVCLTLAGLLSAGIFSMTGTVYASEFSGSPGPAISLSASDTISPRAEETEWKYRIVDTKLQKRLWSITYMKWLTEWEWV